jgi:hypothetical protein
VIRRSRGTRARTRRVLTFHARRIHGQQLIFYERGKGVGRQIRSTRATHGRIRFTPTDGPAGRRTIVAAVLENGLVRRTLRVATFHAPGARRPARVSHLVLSRHGSRVVVTWSRTRGARRYRVHVRVNDGRNQLHTQRGRKLIIRRSAGHSIGVTVQSVSAAGLTRTGATQDARRAAAALTRVSRAHIATRRFRGCPRSSPRSSSGCRRAPASGRTLSARRPP